MKARMLVVLAVTVLAAAILTEGMGSVSAGPAVRLSIATGGVGGVYFPMVAAWRR